MYGHLVEHKKLILKVVYQPNNNFVYVEEMKNWKCVKRALS